MKKYRHLGFTTIFLLVCSCTSTSINHSLPAKLTTPEGYELVWSDNFDTSGLPDPAKWGYDTERNAQGWWNDEKQYYANARLKNTRVEDGYLLIEAHKEATPQAKFSDTGAQQYTSARLYTKGKHTWQYGYFEISAKLPCGKGLWPAIWTLPENGTKWPDDGEIDIMEYVGWDKYGFHATVHTRDRNHTNGSSFGETLEMQDACGAFHTHSMLWTKQQIIMAVDGKPYFNYTNDGGYGKWPFDQAHHLILNLAVGGWGGRQGIDDSAFPAQMLIDYVKVYQKP